MTVHLIAVCLVVSSKLYPAQELSVWSRDNTQWKFLQSQGSSLSEVATTITSVSNVFLFICTLVDINNEVKMLIYMKVLELYIIFLQDLRDKGIHTSFIFNCIWMGPSQRLFDKASYAKKSK